MRLRELRIKNFRKIADLTVSFPKGVSVIVGENNTGKTAIIDALRLMLFPGREFDAIRLNEDDFRNGCGFAPIEISCTFTSLNESDEVRFQECLVDIGDGKFELQLNARAEFNESTRRVNVKMWGGETEGGSFPNNLFDYLASVYLQPLRDPETGLQPSRHSQVSRLIDRVTSKEQQPEFEVIAKDANEKIKTLPTVQSARDIINTQMTSIAGAHLTQKTELMFSDPSFYRIISGLMPEIEGLPFGLNGLGYNNLVFTSATLGTLKQSPQYSFRCILVEEPEAHLHPQLQVLFLRHLVKIASEEGDRDVQVIVSSHSPILASQAPIDSIISLHEISGKVNAVSVCNIEFDEVVKKKLQRFLDATRAEFFFARSILMVEGIAEALLLPVLTKIAGGSLKDSGVTVLNADGINFNAFMPLFKENGIGIKVVILTDGDAKKVGDPFSDTAMQLREETKGVPNLAIEFSERTFEHELARSQDLLPYMIDAFAELHPRKAIELKAAIEGKTDQIEKADEFLRIFLDSKTSKGRYAQELAALLEDTTLDVAAIPLYIVNGLRMLSVIP